MQGLNTKSRHKYKLLQRHINVLQGLNNMLIEHHIKYKEIHGVDETIWMSQSEHLKLHRRIRREKRCNIPVNEMRIIASNAHKRTSKYKTNKKISRSTPEYKEIARKYALEYGRKNKFCKAFTTTFIKNVRLCEFINYNIKTNSLSITSRFQERYGIKLYYIDLD